MSNEQLADSYRRLRQELAQAYSARPWRGEVIDRLADQIATLERTLCQRPAVLPGWRDLRGSGMPPNSGARR